MDLPKVYRNMASKVDSSYEKDVPKKKEIERRLKIAFVSQPEYFRFVYESDLDEFADVFEFQLRMGMSPSSFDSLIEFQADFNFIFRGEFLPDGVLEKLNGKCVALSSEPFPRFINGKLEYTADSIARYLFFRSIRYKEFDHVFHYDAASLPLFKRDGIRVSGQFPFPVATSVYRPHACAKEWDIFFIGRSTAHREQYFGQLKHHFNFLHICHGVFGKALVDYLCKTKISLNVHAENEVSWEPRMQLMLACGAFVISEKITPNQFLRPGIDYVEVGSRAELFDAVNHYMNNDNERIKIADSGRERVIDLLDSRKNFQKLVSDIENDVFDWFRPAKGSRVLNCLAIAVGILTKIKKIAG